MSLNDTKKISCYGIYENKKLSLTIKHTKAYQFVNSLLQHRGTSLCICKQASFTVEAAVVLPFFVCFLVFIMYFFRILQIETGVAQALHYTGRKVAAECYTPDNNLENENQENKKPEIEYANAGAIHATDSKMQTQSHTNDVSFGTMLKAKLYFQRQLEKQECPIQFIQGGLTGISLLQSDFSDQYVTLKAIYKMTLPIHLLGKIQYKMVQEVKCRKWTGYQVGQDHEGEDTWLYYTQYGSVYHASRTCTHLDLSIQGIPYSQVDQNRNQSGGKYHPCEKCDSHSSNHRMVYITNYGDRYHTSLTCSGLKRKIFMIQKSKATDKRMCSKCGSRST